MALYEAALLLAVTLNGLSIIIYPAVSNMLKSERGLNRLYCFFTKGETLESHWTLTVRLTLLENDRLYYKKGGENNQERRLLPTSAYLKNVWFWVDTRVRFYVEEGFRSSLKQNQLMGG